MGRDVAIKLVVAPLLIGAASLAGRRFGHAVGGWLVALPLTSGPVAWFLAREHGDAFAATAALGMLAATASQVAFALAYRAVDGPRWATSFAAGASAFLVSTLLLARLELSALATFALVAGIIAVGLLGTRRGAPPPGYTAPAGLPIILQIGDGSLTPSVTAHTITSGGSAVEHCVFDETSYSNPDGNMQSLGRSVLGGRDAIVLIARQSLTQGAMYTVSVTANGTKYTWSFTVSKNASGAESGISAIAGG